MSFRREADGRGLPVRAGELLLALALASFAVPETTRAQVPRTAGAGTGIEYQRLDFDEPTAVGLESVSLLTVPVAGRATIAEGLTLQISSVWADGEAERTDGTTSSLTGFTDTSLSLGYTFGRDVLDLALVARLPTGQTEYTLGELDAAGLFASDLFPFRISNWGSGGGVGVRAGSTGSIGTVGTAVSVGYFRSGEYDPVRERVTAYRPGDHLSARAAFEVPTGEVGRLDVQLGFEWFAEDEIGDANVFEAGNRYEAVGRYTFSVGGRSSAYLYGGYQRRDEGTRLRLAEPTAAQDLVLTGAGLRLRLSDDLVLRPSLDARILEREDGTSEGYDLRAGSGLEWTTGGLTIGPTVRGHLGNVTVRDGVESGFTGFDLGLAVRFGGGAR